LDLLRRSVRYKTGCLIVFLLRKSFVLKKQGRDALLLKDYPHGHVSGKVISFSRVTLIICEITAKGYPE